MVRGLESEECRALPRVRLFMMPQPTGERPSDLRSLTGETADHPHGSGRRRHRPDAVPDWSARSGADADGESPVRPGGLVTAQVVTGLERIVVPNRECERRATITLADQYAGFRRETKVPVRVIGGEDAEVQ